MPCDWDIRWQAISATVLRPTLYVDLPCMRSNFVFTIRWRGSSWNSKLLIRKHLKISRQINNRVQKASEVSLPKLFVHPQGFEPWTHWLRVSCSANWAKDASFVWATAKVDHSFHSANSFEVFLRPFSVINRLKSQLLCLWFAVERFSSSKKQHHPASIDDAS